MINVLFVDDDVSLRSALRRMLHPMRNEWEMRFAEGGAAALKELANYPADVVVSDMRMPEMDGATLLTHIRDQYPHIARIILSGYSENSLAMRSVPVAHQFISKPCDPELLHEAITRSYTIAQRLSDPELRKLVGNLSHLPSPAPVIDELNAALQSSDITFEQINSVIRSDPALTAKLLQLVNSAFFGLPNQATNVIDALKYLGLTMVRNLAVAVDLFSKVDSDSKAALIDDLHSHAIEVANIARDLVENPIDKEDAFVAGLLHNIGEFALLTSNDETLIYEKGSLHGEIGACLLELWGIPHVITEAVLCHHDEITETSPVGVREAVILAEKMVMSPTNCLV